MKYYFVAVPMRRDVERGWGGPTGMSSVDDVMYFHPTAFLKWHCDL